MIVRKIDAISKWDNPTAVKRHDATVPGDTISDLKTHGNKLSVWLANTDEDIEDAVAALSLSRDDTQKVTMLKLDENKLADIEIDVVDDQLGNAQGASNVILKKHRNLVELDHSRLGKLADYMISQASDPQNRKIFTAGQVKEILNKYKGTKIDPRCVTDKILEKLNWNRHGNS